MTFMLKLMVSFAITTFLISFGCSLLREISAVNSKAERIMDKILIRAAVAFFCSLIGVFVTLIWGW